MIHLTDEQRQALQQSGDRTPVPVYDSQTDRMYFLLSGPLYEQVRGQLEERTVEEVPELLPGIRRSKDAFLRDLPELLRNKRFREKWAGYHGDRRIAIHWNKTEVIREFKRQAIPSNQYYVALIRDRAPEPEEIDPSSAGFPD